MKTQTEETRRRLALGLSPTMPKNRNRYRPKPVFTFSQALLLAVLCFLLGILTHAL